MHSHKRRSAFMLLLVLSPLTMANLTDLAADFIQRQHVGRNLKTLAVSVALRTQTFAVMASKLGTSEAQRLVSQELDAHAGQFQGQWNANLAKIYAQHFTPQELTSLASEGKNSRFFNKLIAKQEVVGTEMEQLSKPILTKYVTATMTSAFDKFSSR